MSSSAKYRFFHWDNKQTYPDWYNQPKSGNYQDWLTEKIDSGLFQQYDRQDPTDPTEPTEPSGGASGETYSDKPHPLAADGIIGSAINAAVNTSKEVEKKLKEYLGDEDEPTSSSGVAAKPIVYSDWSPISRLFGMSQDTAFAEHMANTAHQREVADLKAAGLNPVLGISGSGAASVSGNAAVGSSSAEKVQDFPWMDVLGATAGLVTTLVSKKPALGFMVSNVFKAFD